MTDWEVVQRSHTFLDRVCKRDRRLARRNRGALKDAKDTVVREWVDEAYGGDRKSKDALRKRLHARIYESLATQGKGQKRSKLLGFSPIWLWIAWTIAKILIEWMIKRWYNNQGQIDYSLPDPSDKEIDSMFNEGFWGTRFGKLVVKWLRSAGIAFLIPVLLSVAAWIGSMQIEITGDNATLLAVWLGGLCSLGVSTINLAVKWLKTLKGP